MRLRQIEIFGFKSFADRTIVNLDEGITGVVGPNGSGKSNIGDAVRWVLGEQSARQLRGGKMEDVIFSGTQKRKPLAYAEVTLLFDNADHTLPIDYSEVSVTRRMYRSGESDYAINRNPCRLKDVVELFRDSGIGREGYSLVGQGRVDEILSNRPEDRRNVFHEAAGVMKYRVRLEETARHLEGAQANLDRLQDKMEVLGAQLEPLRKQSEDARAYQQLSVQLKNEEIGLFVAQYRQLTEKSAAAQQTLDRLEGVLDQQQRDEERSRELLGRLQQSVDEAEERIRQLERESGDWMQKASEYENSRQLLERERQFDEERGRTLEEEALREEAQAIEYRKEAHLIGEQLEHPDEAEKSREEELKAGEAAVTELDRKLEEKEAELAALRGQAMSSLENLSGITGDLSRNAQQRKNIQERLDQLAFLTGRSENTRISMEQAIGTCTEEIAQAGKELENLKEKTEQQRTERESLEKRADRMQEAMVRGRERIQQGKTRLQMLQSMKRDYAGYQETVRKLLRDAQNDSELAACMEHVVAEVMTVEKNYRVAIETVLGSSLQQIITPDEQAAKRAIAYLRSHQYGRATFLPVSVIRGRTLNAQETAYARMSGCCGIASELVQTQDRYRPIVDSLLGRTLVAQDMDAAIEIARACRHTLRVVTLQGDLIQTGGAMSGGSQRSHTTSLLGREQELESTQEALTLWQKQFTELAEELESVRGQIRESERLSSRWLEEVHQSDLKISALESDRLRLKQNLETEKKNCADWMLEKEKLESQLADLVETGESMAARKESVSASGDNARRRAAQMQEEINLLREDKDEAQERLSAVRSRQIEFQKDREAAQRQMERLLSDADKLDQSVENRRADQKELLVRMSDALTRSGELLELAKNGRAEAEKAAASMKKFEEERQRLREEYRQREEEGQRQRTDLRSLFEERQTAENDKIRAEGELEHIQMRILDLYDMTYAAAAEAVPKDFVLYGAQTRAEQLRRKIRALGAVNIHAIEEYASGSEQYRNYVTQRDDLVRSRDGLQELADELSASMKERFLENFTSLNHHFEENFSRLFGGGQARLSLTDPSDPLGSGIEIEVEPPGKRLQRLSLLSGGEKAFTAIALLFSMLRLKPTPFCILDEIDAALDDANLTRYARYLKEVFAPNTQFVVVTHRKPSMEICDRLYGVTMEEKGVSKMISMQLSDYSEEQERA